MKDGSFDTVPYMFVSPSSSIIPERLKSLECKVRSPLGVFFEIEVHNFAWGEDLKNKNGNSLTGEDVRTRCFLAIGFVDIAFFD